MNITNCHFFHQLKKLPFVEEIWLFGSRARHDEQSRSDIDLAIVCPSATDEDWHIILKIIENSDTLLKIDCVRFDKLTDEKFKENIIHFKKILFQKRGEYMEKEFWEDYFKSLGDAINRLNEVLNEPELEKNTYMQDATIQRFEFCTELYWKVLKKFLAAEYIDASTPRDVINKAFQFGFIDDEKIWLDMMNDRNKTSHVYRQEIANEVFKHIKRYINTLIKTYGKLKERFYA